MEGEFDEENEALMAVLADAVASNVPNTFPTALKTGVQTQVRVTTAHGALEELIGQFLALLEANLGLFYSRREGPNWTAEKRLEMLETGLVYVYYTDDNGLVICFLSFKLVLEEDGKYLYLYEIHVEKQYQAQQIGHQLLEGFHTLAKHINSISSKKELHFSIIGTALTVFSDNVRALKWYLKTGYKYTPWLPRDTKLRGGRVKKPLLYLLYRPLEK